MPATQCAGVWRQQAQQRAAALQVLVLGLGQMGLAAAKRIALQGYRVHGWSLRPREAPAGPDAIECHSGTHALASLLPASDIVINLLPLTQATAGLLDAGLFAALPRGAGIVNLARGAHVVDADLLAALDSGQLQHAVLDVFHTEPLPAGHAFWSHPRVTVLPHVAAQTDPNSAAQVVAANVRALRRGPPAGPPGADRARLLKRLRRAAATAAARPPGSSGPTAAAGPASADAGRPTGRPASPGASVP